MAKINFVKCRVVSLSLQTNLTNYIPIFGKLYTTAEMKISVSLPCACKLNQSITYGNIRLVTDYMWAVNAKKVLKTHR